MLSVVVPTFNEGDRILGCVDNLLKYDGVAEILVVDASDAEESLSALSQITADDKVRVEQTRDGGRARQMNLGARLATGNTVLFLHCDSVLPDLAVASVERCLQKHQWGRFDVVLDATGWQFRLIETMMNLRSRVTSLATGDQTIFAYRDWFNDQGGFAEIPLMEDIEFSRRVSSQYKPGLVRSRVQTSARRWQRHGVWRTILLMWKLRILYRLGTSPQKLATMYSHAR